MNATYRSWGIAVDACVTKTTEEWFRQHAGMRSREQALAEEVKEITVKSERRLGGFLDVRVGVVARKRDLQQLDLYRFRYKDKIGYVQLDSSQVEL